MDICLLTIEAFSGLINGTLEQEAEEWARTHDMYADKEANSQQGSRRSSKESRKSGNGQPGLSKTSKENPAPPLNPREFKDSQTSGTPKLRCANELIEKKT